MADTGRSFIFHDPSGKRWGRFLRVTQTLVLALLGLATLVIFVGLTGPQLPAIGLPAVAQLVQFNEVPSIIRGQKVEKNIPYRIAKPQKPIRYVRSASPVLRPKPAAQPSDSAPLVWGFYVNWDRASMVSLRFHANQLTHLVPEWFILQNDKGDIDDQTDPTVVAIAHEAHLPIIAMLTNFRDGWQAGDLHRILNDARRRKDLIENVRSNLAEHKFQGINIDLEELPARDREVMLTFMHELTGVLHPLGYLVTESVPVDDEAYDLKRLAEVNDYILPMVYDEHYQSGEPGPVASEAFFEEQMEKLSKVLPARKTIVGFGNYGYDWIIGEQGGAEVAFDDVMAAATVSRQPVKWDSDTNNPVLRYSASGKNHEVWFLDAVTALNHIIDVRDAGFRGVGLWRLGAEDPGMWKTLSQNQWPQDSFPVSELASLAANQQAPRHYGIGEILRVTQTPHGGSRTVTAPAGDIVDFTEKYAQYPTPYVVTHAGETEKKILCLTFDDGPDREFTPKILDILKEKKVPATFFIVGVNAEDNPDLIKREYAEGHELGNHTYTHPNIAITSPRRTELELSTTQRILENLLGVATTLFRPPYNADSEPVTPEEIEPIYRAQQYGYTTVAETIDPRDWQPGITEAAIISDIDSELDVDSKENTNAHIILLHDAGGNRASTIEALPGIIDRYVGLGYRFTTVGELVGKTRAQVMPKPTEDEMRMARIEGQALDAKARFRQALGLLFLIAIYLTVARSVIYGFLAILQKVRHSKEQFDDSYLPPVSVILAAFNEEKVILRTVDSILSNGYAGELEIVVVDDGSKDATFRILRERFGNDERVTVLTQRNAGKSAALNQAISYAKHEVLIAVDADTLFRKGTIQKLARYFKDEKVGAVSGNARVGNRSRWITRFQSIEYVYGFNLDRRALDYLNAITVVPGAVGAWRRSLIVQQGGFGHDTLAEDADLTMAVRRMGFVIRYEQDAIAYTEAPENTADLAKQRFRWAFGTLQAAWKHRDALFVPRYGTLGFIALPSIWVFQVLLSALSPFAEVSMAMSLIAGNWKLVLLYYFGFFFLEFLTGFLAYGLEGIAPWDLSLLFFQRIYYRQLMLFVLAKSMLFAVRGRLVGWGKLERKASVTQS